ncbi:MAG TPA: DUF4836 family protein [Salinivirgaceae bacterium]|nr:DUF4836 family protein [Salinivirgaceae bacterium]
MLWKSFLWGWIMLILTVSCSKKASISLNPPKQCALAIKTNLWEIAKKAELFNPQYLNSTKNPLNQFADKIPQYINFQNFNIISSGVNFFEPAYLFITTDEKRTENTIILVGEMANRAQFSTTIKLLLPKENDSLKSETMGEIEILKFDNLATAWNQTHFILALGEQGSSIETVFYDIFKPLDSKTYPGFDLFLADKSDVSVWVSTLWMNNQLKNPFESMISIPFAPQETFINISLNFNNGGFSAFISSKTPSMKENFLSFLKNQLVQSSN